MRRDRRVEEVGTDEVAVETAHAGREQRFDVFVTALLAAGGNRLHARRAQAERAETPQERSGDERLADAGIGSGDEEPGLHSSLSSSATVRSTRRSISSGSITYGGMKYTVRPSGRSRSSRSSAAAWKRRANAGSSVSTSKAQIMPVLRQCRTRRCKAISFPLAMNRRAFSRFDSRTRSSSKTESAARAARQASGLPV